MPDFTTHHLFGEELLSLLSKAARDMALADAVAFRWGLQGPDPLFYRSLFPGGAHAAGYGSRMHRESTGALMRALSDCVQAGAREERGTLASYFLGFVCHWALDSAVHPYVYALVQRRKKSAARGEWPSLHGTAECHIDELLYFMKTGRPVTDFHPDAFYRPGARFTAPVGRLYETVLRQAYQIAFSAGKAAASFSGCLWITRLLYHPAARAAAPALGCLERLAGRPHGVTCHIKGRLVGDDRDVLNLAHAPWRNPEEPARSRRESVPELFDAALIRARELCEQYCTQFSTGKPETVDYPVPFDFGGHAALE